MSNSRSDSAVEASTEKNAACTKPVARSIDTPASIVVDVTDFQQTACLKQITSPSDENTTQKLLAISKMLHKKEVDSQRLLTALKNLPADPFPFSAYCQYILQKLMVLYARQNENASLQDIIIGILQTYQNKLFLQNKNKLVLWVHPHSGETILSITTRCDKFEFLSELISIIKKTDDSGTLLNQLLLKINNYFHTPLSIAAHVENGAALIGLLLTEEIRNKMSNLDCKNLFTQTDENGFFLLLTAVTLMKKKNKTALSANQKQEDELRIKKKVEALLDQAEIIFQNDEHQLLLHEYAAHLAQYSQKNQLSPFSAAVNRQYQTVVELFLEKAKNTVERDPAIAKDLYRAWLEQCQALQHPTPQTLIIERMLETRIKKCETLLTPPPAPTLAAHTKEMAVSPAVMPASAPIAPFPGVLTRSRVPVRLAQTNFQAMLKEVPTPLSLKKGLESIAQAIKQQGMLFNSDLHKTLEPHLQTIKQNLPPNQFSEYLQYLLCYMIPSEQNSDSLMTLSFVEQHQSELFSSPDSTEPVIWRDPLSQETALALAIRWNRPKLVQALLDAAARQDARMGGLLLTLLSTPNGNHYMPLASASAKEDRIETAKCIVAAIKTLSLADRRQCVKP